MKILLISYGDLDYDGRLRSLISVFNRIGDVYTFTRGSKLLSKHGRICNSSYIFFILSAVNYAKILGKIDLLVLDNRKATIPGFLIKLLLNPGYTIQDCRELYLFNEVQHFTGKVGCLFEKLMVRKADIVISANNERAEIMKQEYLLDKQPLVYENVRMLVYSSEGEKAKARLRFAPYMKGDEIRIISSSGCSISRTNDVLVKNLKNVSKKCRLFLVGNSTIADEETIKRLAACDSKNVVEILGQLNQTELKYLISQCHIGVVNYGQYDTNNKLCASGKLYEFLYEGIPVVTTTNPPLKRFCDTEKVGIADDNYANGINEIIHKYDFYKNRVDYFINRNTPIRYEDEIVDVIKEQLNANFK